MRMEGLALNVYATLHVQTSTAVVELQWKNNNRDYNDFQFTQELDHTTSFVDLERR